MRVERLKSGFLFFVIILLLSGCGRAAVRVSDTPTERPGEPPTATATLFPTLTPTPTWTCSPTRTSTPTPTSTSTPTPMPTSTLTSTPDPALWLPDAAEIVHHQVSGDLNGDGVVENIVLVGYGGSPERLGYDALELFVLQPQAEDPVVWHSGHLVGDRAQALEVDDVNDDGQPEVLSVQSMGAAGQTLYVLAWRGTNYGFLRPHGGYFDGQDTFGDNSVRVEDLNGDGVKEIRASHGPVASIHEIYRWDGTRYVHERTVEE